MTLKAARSRTERIRQEVATRRARVENAGGQALALQRAHEALGVESRRSQIPFDAIEIPPTEIPSTPQRQARADGAQPNLSAIWLAVEQLQLDPIYGRSIFDESAQEELNASVAEHGILEPVLVRPLVQPKGLKTHQLVAGYRRLRAAQNAGQEIVPAMERRMDDVEAAQISVSENLQRQNPHPGDVGLALLNLKEQMQKAVDKVDAQNARAVRGEELPTTKGEKSGLLSSNYFKNPPKLAPWMAQIFEHAYANGRKPRVRWDDVAARVQLHKRTIMYYLDIAKLPPDVMEQVAATGASGEGKLSARQARAIAGVEGASQQRALAKRALAQGWTGDQIAAYVRRKNENTNDSAAADQTDANQTDGGRTASTAPEVFPTAALQTLVREIGREDKSARLLEIAQTLENDTHVTPAYAETITTEIERIRSARATEAELLARIENAVKAA